ncbi:hypothetical protein N2152v2_003386 [Parachlorella kessleri]
MLKRLGLLRSLLLAAGVLFGLGYTPASVKAAVGKGLLAGLGSVATPVKSADPLREAITNVTTDFNELAHLIGDFMRTQPEQTQSQFVQFMADRATRSYPQLEGLLDWLLSLYKFAFPFLIISMVAKLSGGDDSGGERSTADREPQYLSLDQAYSGPLLQQSSSRQLPALERSLTGGRGQAGLSRRASAAAQQAQQGGQAAQREEGEEAAETVGSLGGRLPSRVLSKAPAGQADKGIGNGLAPSTPMERQPRSQPLQPVQLQGDD